MNLKYGAEGLADKYCESWMNSFILHAPRDSRVDMFGRFMGLTGTNNWPFSVFRYYLQMLKVSNIQISTLFTKDSNWSEIFINY